MNNYIMSLSHRLFVWCQRYINYTAVQDATTGMIYTYWQLYEDTYTLGNFIKENIKSEEYVLLSCPLTYEYIVSYIAALKEGCNIIIIDPAESDETVQEILNTYIPTVVIGDKRTCNLALQNKLPILCILNYKGLSKLVGMKKQKSLLDTNAIEDDTRKTNSNIYKLNNTLKLVSHTAEQLLHCADTTCINFYYRPHDRILLVPSKNQILLEVTILQLLQSGSTIVLPNLQSPTGILDAINNYYCRSIHTTTDVLQDLCNLLEQDKSLTRPTYLYLIVIEGKCLTESFNALLRTKLGTRDIILRYGNHELLEIAQLSPFIINQGDITGIPSDGIIIKIEHFESNQFNSKINPKIPDWAHVGKILAFKNTSIVSPTQHYLDCILDTGDIGYFDNKGYLHVLS